MNQGDPQGIVNLSQENFMNIVSICGWDGGSVTLKGARLNTEPWNLLEMNNIGHYSVQRVTSLPSYEETGPLKY